MNVAISAHGHTTGRRRIAVVGSGISGAAAAWALNDTADVTLFEAARGRAAIPPPSTSTMTAAIAVDTGFIVYNELNYPDLTALFAASRRRHARERHGVFAVARRRPAGMVRHEPALDLRAEAQCLLAVLPVDAARDPALQPPMRRRPRRRPARRTRTIGEYLEQRRFSAGFRDNYLIPMAAAIWSTPRAKMLDYPAADLHHLLRKPPPASTDERPAWRTVTGGSRNYLEKLLAPLGRRVQLGDAGRDDRPRRVRRHRLDRRAGRRSASTT